MTHTTTAASPAARAAATAAMIDNARHQVWRVVGLLAETPGLTGDARLRVSVAADLAADAAAALDRALDAPAPATADERSDYTTAATGEIYVCGCCALAISAGEPCECPASAHPATDIFSLTGATMGGTSGPERIDFSWSRCQACGSVLGGERHLDE